MKVRGRTYQVTFEGEKPVEVVCEFSTSTSVRAARRTTWCGRVRKPSHTARRAIQAAEVEIARAKK
ncbi:MAG: hypothetical protein WDN04_13630 [Rhodospirillales bacterium]